jgi:hypothetical protein
MVLYGYNQIVNANLSSVRHCIDHRTVINISSDEKTNPMRRVRVFDMQRQLSNQHSFDDSHVEML